MPLNTEHRTKFPPRPLSRLEALSGEMTCEGTDFMGNGLRGGKAGRVSGPTLAAAGGPPLSESSGMPSAASVTSARGSAPRRRRR